MADEEMDFAGLTVTKVDIAPEEEKEEPPPTTTQETPPADDDDTTKAPEPKQDAEPVAAETPKPTEHPIDPQQQPTQPQDDAEQEQVPEEPPKATANALEFSCVIGCDTISSGNCHYLADKGREEIFYISGNAGVLLAHQDGQQAILRGHRNTIYSTTISADKRWLATADVGKDGVLIIWDTIAGTPVRTWFDLTAVSALAFSSDSALIAVASSTNGDPEISLWDWSNSESSDAIGTVSLKGFTCAPLQMSFHNQSQTTLVMTCHDQVQVLKIDYNGVGSQMKLHNNNFDAKMAKAKGDFVQSMFIPDTPTVVSTTTSGYVLLWEIDQLVDGEGLECKQILQLTERKITYAAFTPDGATLVTGSDDGVIRYFDRSFRLVGWVDELNLGSITSISFAAEVVHSNVAPPFSPIAAKHPTLPNYVVSTATGKIVRVVNTPGQESSEEVLDGHNLPVEALATHPTQPLLAIGGMSGKLQIWNYVSRADVISRNVAQDKQGQAHITHMSFNPDGNLLVLGFVDGKISIRDSLSLTSLASDATDFKDMSGRITKIVFSHNGVYFAVADEDKYVGVFKAQQGNMQEPWLFVGKHRSHSAAITDVVFLTEADGVTPRLLSVGKDRMMAEYDLENSSFDEGLLLGARAGQPRVEIEQTSLPQALAVYPNPGGEAFLVTANSDYKFKLLNATTKMCRKTVVAPTSGGIPLTHIAVVPKTEGSGPRVLAYTAGEKIGLSLMPLDGNPHHNMSVMAHADTVTCMVCSSDGRYLFSAGGRTTHMWELHPQVLESSSALGGTGAVPFINMLHGGQEGALFADMKEYFYYAQVEAQGVNSMQQRKVSDHVDLKLVPRVLRALGYFPSDAEIVNIMNEVKFSTFFTTNEHVTTVDINELVRLFVNHRPVLGMEANAMEEAFESLDESADIKSADIATDDLVSTLKNIGEHFTEAELAAVLSKLLGADSLASVLGDKVTANAFTSDILGF